MVIKDTTSSSLQESSEAKQNPMTKPIVKERPTVDPQRVSAWNRWFQERQKRKQLKSGDPFLQDDNLTEGENNNSKSQINPIDQQPTNKICTNKDSPIVESHSKNVCSIQSSLKSDYSKPIADALREASLKSKDKKSVSYDCFSTQSNAKLNEWLQVYKPSQIRESIENIGSLVIYGFNKSETQLSEYKDKFEMNSSKSLERDAPLLKEWKEITDDNNAKVTYTTICEIAKKYNVLGGKWLFSSHPNTIDSTWGNICYQINKAAAAATREYKSNSVIDSEVQGIPCIAAKLSPGLENIDHLKTGKKSRDKGTYMIFIYTADFMDDKSIFEIEKSLRRCGIHSSMTYKPDIFSALGIYRQNKFNLRPTIYQSRWTSNQESDEDSMKGVFPNGNSVIESCINEFKWTRINSPVTSIAVSEKPNDQIISSYRSESKSPENKGKLGRNIVLQVLKRKQHEAKELDQNIATKNTSPANSNTLNTTVPIWVGKVPQNVTDDMIKADCESNFGTVAKIERHSFCYVTYQDDLSVEKMLQTSLQIGGKAKLAGHMLEVKPKRGCEKEKTAISS